MCFAPQADLIAGTVITAIGVDAVRHIGGRREFVGLAALPLLFGLHQLTETFVWWGLQGHVPSQVGTAATWLYLLFAFVVLPTYVPVAVFAVEPPGRRRRFIGVLVVLGALVSLALLAAMLRGPITAQLQPWHLKYETGLRAGGLVVTIYVLATCGSFLFSGIKNLMYFGIVNLVAVAAVAVLVLDGFASVWCGWAAIMSALFAIHLRRTSPERALAGAAA